MVMNSAALGRVRGWRCAGLISSLEVLLFSSWIVIDAFYYSSAHTHRSDRTNLKNHPDAAFSMTGTISTDLNPHCPSNVAIKHTTNTPIKLSPSSPPQSSTLSLLFVLPPTLQTPSRQPIMLQIAPQSSPFLTPHSHEIVEIHLPRLP